MAWTISAIAGQVGVSADTLRYYERRGLLAPSGRTPSGYRLYDDEAVERLRFIKNAQHAGLRLDDIGQLLEVLDRGRCPCGHTAALVEQRLAEVDAEIARLTSLRHKLAEIGQRSRDCTELDRDAWWCATSVSPTIPGLERR